MPKADRDLISEMMCGAAEVVGRNVEDVPQANEMINALDDCAVGVGRHDGPKFIEVLRNLPAYFEEVAKCEENIDRGEETNQIIWGIPEGFQDYLLNEDLSMDGESSNDS